MKGYRGVKGKRCSNRVLPTVRTINFPSCGWIYFHRGEDEKLCTINNEEILMLSSIYHHHVPPGTVEGAQHCNCEVVVLGHDTDKKI